MMSKSSLAVLATVFAFFAIVYALVRSESDKPNVSSEQSASHLESHRKVEIHLRCAASNQAVIEEVRRKYEAEFGRSVIVQYGSSQSLLSQLEITKSGDLFLPADDSYIDIAQRKGLTAEVIPIAKMQCGLVVKKGNPLGLHSLQSILDSKAKLVQAAPETAAVGKITRQVLQRSGDWDAIDRATVAYRGMVTEVANDIRVGAADVGIVYDVVLHPYDDLEFVAIPELKDAVSQVSICVLDSATNPENALHFARYITARDRGQIPYQKYGFQIIPGDVWDASRK